MKISMHLAALRGRNACNRFDPAITRPSTLKPPLNLNHRIRILHQFFPQPHPATPCRVKSSSVGPSPLLINNPTPPPPG